MLLRATNYSSLLLFSHQRKMTDGFSVACNRGRNQQHQITCCWCAPSLMLPATTFGVEAKDDAPEVAWWDGCSLIAEKVCVVLFRSIFITVSVSSSAPQILVLLSCNGYYAQYPALDRYFLTLFNLYYFRVSLLFTVLLLNLNL